ncbi:MAG: hypothetical protein ACM3SP_17640 [Chloroflexota bacterium]
MAQLEKAQKNQLKALMRRFQQAQKQLQAIHKKSGYEDLAHGVLALQIAEHTLEETLEHTGLGGEIQHKKNIKAHRQAKQWHKIVRGLRVQGGKLLKTHPSEDLETALKALEIAEGSLEEVVEHYE